MLRADGRRLARRKAGRVTTCRDACYWAHVHVEQTPNAAHRMNFHSSGNTRHCGICNVLRTIVVRGALKVCASSLVRAGVRTDGLACVRVCVCVREPQPALERWSTRTSEHRCCVFVCVCVWLWCVCCVCRHSRRSTKSCTI